MVPKEANVKFEEQLDLLDLIPNDENNNVKFEEHQVDLGIACLVLLVKGCFEASDKVEALISAQL